MLIDSKGKLFGKISIVDILIIVVILLAIAGVGYKFTRSSLLKQDNLEVEFYVEETPDYAAQAINTGDVIKDITKGSVLGTVTGKTVAPSISFAANSQGQYVASSKQGYDSVKVTATASGKYSQNSVTFDSAEYFIGQSYQLRMGNSAVYGRISSIKKKE